MWHDILQIFWYFWCVIFLIIGFVIALGRIDDWSDPNHKVGQKYKKTYFK